MAVMVTLAEVLMRALQENFCSMVVIKWGKNNSVQMITVLVKLTEPEKEMNSSNTTVTKRGYLVLLSI